MSDLSNNIIFNNLSEKIKQSDSKLSCETIFTLNLQDIIKMCISITKSTDIKLESLFDIINFIEEYYTDVSLQIAIREILLEKIADREDEILRDLDGYFENYESFEVMDAVISFLLNLYDNYGFFDFDIDRILNNKPIALSDTGVRDEIYSILEQRYGSTKKFFNTETISFIENNFDEDSKLDKSFCIKTLKDMDVRTGKNMFYFINDNLTIPVKNDSRELLKNYILDVKLQQNVIDNINLHLMNGNNYLLKKIKKLPDFKKFSLQKLATILWNIHYNVIISKGLFSEDVKNLVDYYSDETIVIDKIKTYLLNNISSTNSD